MSVSKATKEARIEKFAQAIISGENQSDAYRMSHPQSKRWKDNTIHVEASLLAKDPKVVQRIQELREQAIEESKITAAKVLAQLVLYSSYDIRLLHDKDGKPLEVHQIPDEIAPAVVGVSRYPNGNIREYKMVSKDKAIELLGRYFNMFGEKLGDTPGDADKPFDIREVARKMLFLFHVADQAPTQH